MADITLAERELDPEHIADKMSRLDILGKGNDGSIINIEVQIASVTVKMETAAGAAANPAG